MQKFVSALFAVSILAGCGGGSSSSVPRSNFWLMDSTVSGPTFTLAEKHCSADQTRGHGSANVGCDPPYAPTGLLVRLGPGCTGSTVTRTSPGTYTVTTIVSPPILCPVIVVDASTAATGAAAVLGAVTPDPGPSAWPPCAATSTVTAGDLMTSPVPNSIVTASTTSITVPRVNGVAGATLHIQDDQGRDLTGGVFTASGSSSLTATLPALPPVNPLAPGTRYEAWASGVPCGPAIDFGGFVGP